MTRHRFAREVGAALLTAMLTVTLVATFAAAALWQQWRSAEIEGAERARAQAGLVLIGALDWSRLILREDSRASGAGSGVDHLAEPWAVPLEEAKLTTFLMAEKNIASDALEGLPEAFLSGRISDAQSKLNVLNLVNAGKPVAASVATFTKLFQLLNLPAGDVALLTQNLQQALPANASVPDPANTPAAAASAAAGSPTGTAGNANTGSGAAPGVPLVPQRTAQLVWLGLSPATVAALEPYVTVLPVRTPLNLNTASAEAIFASLPSLDLAGAKRLVETRGRSYFKTVADANLLIPQSSDKFATEQHSVSTRFFEVQARLRIDKTWVEEQTLLQRDNLDVRMVWRERGAGATPTAAKP